MKKSKRYQTLFLALLLLYCLYAGLFIYRSSFIVDGERYFSLFDDAMISMQYAKNLANGHGLVWNPGGEKVEGYTNPLWVVLMSFVHLLPVVPSKMSLLIQILGAVFLLVNLLFVKRLSELISDDSAVVTFTALMMTAFYLALNYWSLLGMEVSLLTLLTTASVWKFLHTLKQNRFSWWSYVLPGIAMLVRPDMLILLIAILLFAIVNDRTNRGKHLLFGLSAAFLVLVALTGFRLIYYGEILPNTYYLKMAGYPVLLRLTRGLYVFLQFILRINWVLFLVPFFLLFAKRNRYIVFLFWIFGLQVLYSIYVGGDAWELWGRDSRFISIAMPLYFILFCNSFVNLLHKLGEKTSLSVKQLNYCAILLTIFSLVHLNANNGPASLLESFLIKKPYLVDKHENNVLIASELNRLTTPQAKIAVIWAGIIPYFSNRYAIDLLGKNDKKIAHQVSRILPGVARYTGYLPGHTKWNYGYSIGQLQPDVIVRLVRADVTGARQYLECCYIKLKLQGMELFLRKGATNIHWDKINSVLNTTREG